MKTLLALVAGATLTLFSSSVAAAQVSGVMPKFADATWFNTPALTVEDLEGRAVLVEIFRTW